MSCTTAKENTKFSKKQVIQAIEDLGLHFNQLQFSMHDDHAMYFITTDVNTQCSAELKVTYGNDGYEPAELYIKHVGHEDWYYIETLIVLLEESPVLH